MKSLWLRFMEWGPDAHGSTRTLGLLRIACAALVWATWAPHMILYEHASLGHALLGFIFFVASTLMFVGLFSRTTTALTALTVFFFYHGLGGPPLTSGIMHHHHYLLACVVVLLALSPCGRSFSLDRLLALRRAERAGTRAPDEQGFLWAQRLICLQLAAVYLWGTQSRIEPAFLSGERIQHVWMHFYSGADLPDFPLFVPLCQAAALLTIVVEIALGVGLFFRRFQPWLMAVGIVFHGLLYWLIDVESFTLITLALYLSFLPPESVHRFCSRMMSGTGPAN